MKGTPFTTSTLDLRVPHLLCLLELWAGPMPQQTLLGFSWGLNSPPDNNGEVPVYPDMHWQDYTRFSFLFLKGSYEVSATSKVVH